MMYNEKAADEILVGEQNNNAAMVEPQMMVRREYGDNHTRDFLGVRNGMKTGGGMMADHNENGIGTKWPDSKASTSAEARPFVPRRSGGDPTWLRQMHGVTSTDPWISSPKQIDQGAGSHH
ncbi:hypothetical protein ACET3Z_032168 [Daucus carota]